MKQREQKEFARDMAYMKDDIWEDGEILKTFGHDPATYPNQDNPQHYPNVQFAGNPESNNKNHVLQDAEAKRTDINDALRAPKTNAEGAFARDGSYMREDLWKEAPVEPTGVERTERGNQEDGLDFQSREGGREYGKPAKFEFNHQGGYMQSDIFKEPEAPVEPQEPEEPEEPEEPKEPEAPVEPQEPETPEEPKECPPQDESCADGTLGSALAAADKAAEVVEKTIEPIAQDGDVNNG